MILLSIDWTNLHELLRSLYDEMMPLCEDMASVAKGVAGIGALFYVAYRVWQSLSRAEEIDVFPLFRPFVLGLCIMFFPTMVLGTINGILPRMQCHFLTGGTADFRHEEVSGREGRTGTGSDAA